MRLNALKYPTTPLQTIKHFNQQPTTAGMNGYGKLLPVQEKKILSKKKKRKFMIRPPAF
jgi:hypothetical protein